MNRFRLALLTGSLAAAALLAPAAASAGTLAVNYTAGSVVYQALPGENNNFSLGPMGGGMYVIQDHNVASVPLSELLSATCASMEPWKYKCPMTGLSTLTAALGDGTDTFDDGGANLATTVQAGTGSKTISTGSGNDQIFARNGSVDHIDCGAGYDTVTADSNDVVAADCEQVVRGTFTGSLPPTPGTSTTATPTPTSGSSTTSGNAGGSVFQTPLGLTFPAQSISLPRPDTALVPLSCAATAIGGCQGEVIFEQPGAATKAAARAEVTAARGHFIAQQHARGRRLGRRTFRLAAGTSKSLPVRILFRGHYVLESKRRHSRVLMKVVERDSSGKIAAVQTRTVTLSLAQKGSAR